MPNVSKTEAQDKSFLLFYARSIETSFSFVVDRRFQNRTAWARTISHQLDSRLLLSLCAVHLKLPQKPDLLPQIEAKWTIKYKLVEFPSFCHMLGQCNGQWCDFRVLRTMEDFCCTLYFSCPKGNLVFVPN